jgi:hypothetical protein
VTVLALLALLADASLEVWAQRVLIIHLAIFRKLNFSDLLEEGSKQSLLGCALFLDLLLLVLFCF